MLHRLLRRGYVILEQVQHAKHGQPPSLIFEVEVLYDLRHRVEDIVEEAIIVVLKQDEAAFFNDTLTILVSLAH